jgi:hypothetical protein
MDGGETSGDKMIEDGPGGETRLTGISKGGKFGPAEGLRISLSGSGSVAIGGQQVRFATRHAELILYLLVLAGDDGLPRDELIAAVWPEVIPIEGRPRLRTALWQIRRSLGVHAWRLERERGVVRVSLEGVAVEIGAQAPVVGSTILVGWNFTMPATLCKRVA